MTRIAVQFDRPAGGTFSHFAHFITDFTLPLYSLARALSFEPHLQHGGITIELLNSWPTKLGPMLSLAREIFPGLVIETVTRYSQKPIVIRRAPWLNNRDDICAFVGYLKRVLAVKSYEYGVIIVQRGTDRKHYPGSGFFTRSGADRRKIGSGFAKLVSKVKEKRPDTIGVTLEELSFAQQVSLFLGADTLIGQHGAAFVHAHWMPSGAHLIELQCWKACLCPKMVQVIANLLGHRSSVVYYGCRTVEGCLIMNIQSAAPVLDLVQPKPAISRRVPL